jgi:phage terminase Nu1 subunit (DNA packaging protein)
LPKTVKAKTTKKPRANSARKKQSKAKPKSAAKAAPKAKPKRIVQHQNEVAKHFDCSLSAVRNWKQRGMPGIPGKYDLDEIAQWREDNFRRKPEDDQANWKNNQENSVKLNNDRQRFAKAQADREEALAAMAKMEASLREGNFADLDEVNLFFADFFTELRRLLQRIPVEMPPGYPQRFRAAIRKDVQQRLELVLDQMHDWTLRTEDLKVDK